MNRLIVPGQREAIAQALAWLPEGITDRLRHVNFLSGVDPVFAGLHGYRWATDGRAYNLTAHTSFMFHSSDRTTTIVLPVFGGPQVVVHELGHALDEALGFTHNAVPVTAYARTNRLEAFAEAFVAWRFYYGDQDAFMRDEATRALFDQLIHAGGS